MMKKYMEFLDDNYQEDLLLSNVFFSVFSESMESTASSVVPSRVGVSLLPAACFSPVGPMPL